jgi:hypothetical protein
MQSWASFLIIKVCPIGSLCTPRQLVSKRQEDIRIFVLDDIYEVLGLCILRHETVGLRLGNGLRSFK